MLIKGFEQKSEVDNALDNVLDKVQEQGSAGISTPETKTTMGFIHKGFYIQALSPDGVKWKAMARDMFHKALTLESQWCLNDRDAIQEVMKYVDILTRKLV